MRIVPAVFLGLSLAALPALGDTRSEHLSALMDAAGVTQAFDAARDMVRQQARSDADRGMASLLTQLDAGPEVVAQLRQAYGEFIDEVTAAAMHRDEMAVIWGEAYGASFSDEEISELLAFYQSPLGQKAVAASRSAMPKVMEKMQADLNPRLQPAIQRYTGKVQKIIAECHCERPSQPSEK